MSSSNVLVNPVATSAISTAQTSGVIVQSSMAGTQQTSVPAQAIITTTQGIIMYK